MAPHQYIVRELEEHEITELGGRDARSTRRRPRTRVDLAEECRWKLGYCVR